MASMKRSGSKNRSISADLGIASVWPGSCGARISMHSCAVNMFLHNSSSNLSEMVKELLHGFEWNNLEFQLLRPSNDDHFGLASD